MRSDAKTVAEYLANLPDDRRQSIGILRKLLRTHLDPGLVEVMQYGMITYAVPHSVYPAGYHCNPSDPLPVASLASQKNSLSLYLMSVYADPQLSTWLDQAWKEAGYRLDRGKSCLRFRSHEDVPLDVLAELLRKIDVPGYIRLYESYLGGQRRTESADRGTKRSTGPGKSRKEPPSPKPGKRTRAVSKPGSKRGADPGKSAAAGGAAKSSSASGRKPRVKKSAGSTTATARSGSAQTGGSQSPPSTKRTASSSRTKKAARKSADN